MTGNIACLRCINFQKQIWNWIITKMCLATQSHAHYQWCLMWSTDRKLFDCVYFHIVGNSDCVKTMNLQSFSLWLLTFHGLSTLVNWCGFWHTVFMVLKRVSICAAEYLFWFHFTKVLMKQLQWSIWLWNPELETTLHPELYCTQQLFNVKPVSVEHAHN